MILRKKILNKLLFRFSMLRFNRNGNIFIIVSHVISSELVSNSVIYANQIKL